MVRTDENGNKYQKLRERERGGGEWERGGEKGRGGGAKRERERGKKGEREGVKRNLLILRFFHLNI